MSKRVVMLWSVSFLALNACSGGGSGAGGEAKSGGGGGLALSDVAGTWYKTDSMGGKMISSDDCGASRQFVSVSPKQLNVNLGQEDLVYEIWDAKAQGDSLQVQASMQGSSEKTMHTIRYTDATKKVLMWQEAGGEIWSLEREEALKADGRFYTVCCTNTGEGIGEEYATVSGNEACPPAPGK